MTDWLAANTPPESGRAALIHNDYKLDNVVFDARQPDRLIGVLDWEMATIGDPLMDLGCSMAYWVEADDGPELLATRMLPTHLPGSLSRAEVLDRYAAATGRLSSSFRFYRVFGLFRLAVIIQQIYYRYFHGQTRDPRFAALGPMAHVLIRSRPGRSEGMKGPPPLVQAPFSAPVSDAALEHLRDGAPCPIYMVVRGSEWSMSMRDSKRWLACVGCLLRQDRPMTSAPKMHVRIPTKMHRAVRHRVGQMHAGCRGRSGQDAGLRRQVQRLPAGLRGSRLNRPPRGARGRTESAGQLITDISYILRSPKHVGFAGGCH